MRFRSWSVTLIGIVFLIGAIAQAQPADIPSPEQFFGHKPGADFKMIRWEKIHEYFQLLGQNSDRVEIQNLGQTTMGNPFILAVISSPENLADADKYKEIARKLARGTITEEEADRLVEEGKTISLITCSMHATECGPTQMSPLLGYALATEDSPRIRQILDNVIFLLVPSFNPDGNVMVVDWYRKNLGTPYEAAPMPWLYHHYTGHDNNRDGFMLTQVEVQYVTKVLYKEWFPQMLFDMHHMGATDARLFISPYHNPRNPSIHPLVTRQIELTGAHIRTEMEGMGFEGLIHSVNWDGWWQAATFTNAWWHNVVSLLFEAAGTRLATPIYQSSRDLTGQGSGGLGKLGNYQLIEYPNPWPGGWWRLGDIVDYAYWASFGFLESAARNRETYLKNMYRMAADAIEKGKAEAPYAYIVPMVQRDPNTAVKMLNILIANGAEVQRATAPFDVENRQYPAGTYVVLMSQAYRPFLRDMLGPQVYPDISQYPGGPPRPDWMPFDLTGWTLSYQMGVEAREVTFPFDAELEPVEEAEAPAGKVTGTGDSYILDHAVLDSFRAINRLLKDGARVSWATRPFTSGGTAYPAGSIIVSGAGVSSKVRSLAEEFDLEIQGGTGPGDALRLKPLKLGLYQPWTASMDEGWYRWIFDTWEFPYRTVHDAEIRNGDLNREYDVILLASISPEDILEGHGEGTVPSQYAGGIGNAGLTNLIRFVKDGGTLITADQSSNLVIDHFQIPVKNVVRGLQPEEFSCPGTLLKVELEEAHPITYGMDREAVIMFTRSPVFEITEKTDEAHPVRALARYPDVNPLMSGWVWGAEKLYNKVSLIEADYGKGKLILFGFRPQNRAQPHGTFKLLFNALYYGPASTTGGP